jgi:hypothetical protein
MAEYSARLDEQIGQMLARRGSVTSEMLAGFEDREAEGLLRRYAELHANEVGCMFDGTALILPDAVASAPEPAGRLSPVEQVLAAPVGPSLLDSRPAGKAYPKWLWGLVFIFGPLGGIAAWLLLREDNPGAGRAMLITSVVLLLVQLSTGLVVKGSMAHLLAIVR